MGGYPTRFCEKSKTLGTGFILRIRIQNNGRESRCLLALFVLREGEWSVNFETYGIKLANKKHYLIKAATL